MRLEASRTEDLPANMGVDGKRRPRKAQGPCSSRPPASGMMDPFDASRLASTGMITVHQTWTFTGTACIRRRCVLSIRWTSTNARKRGARKLVGAGKEREEGRAPKERHIGNASRHPRFGFGACALLRADGARPPTLVLHVLHVCLNVVFSSANVCFTNTPRNACAYDSHTLNDPLFHPASVAGSIGSLGVHTHRPQYENRQRIYQRRSQSHSTASLLNMVEDKYIGLLLALGGSVGIGSSFILTKKVRAYTSQFPRPYSQLTGRVLCKPARRRLMLLRRIATHTSKVHYGGWA